MSDVEHISKESQEDSPTPSFLAQLGLRRLSEAASSENTLFKKTGEDNNANREFLEEVMGDKFEQMDISAEESASMTDSCDEFDRIKMASNVATVPTKTKARSTLVAARVRSSKGDVDKLAAKSDVELNDVGKRLHNLLKLPLAHRWLVCEFLYSDIDRAIFESQSTQSLRSETLDRRKWRLMRSNIGRPRRLSPTFLLRERIELERKRRIMRFLQQRKYEAIKNTDILNEVPSEVPFTLPADTKVCVRLDLPDCGILFGIIAGYEVKNGIYFVNMMNRELGMRRVPDYRVYNLQPAKVFTVNCIVHQISNGGISERINIIDNGSQVGVQPQVNNCPEETQKALVRLETFTRIKREKVLRLTQMNDTFEQQQTHELRHPTSQERELFQRRYVSLMVTLHRLNNDILEPLNAMHDYVNARNREGKDEEYFSSIELLKKSRSTTEFAFEHELRMAHINSTANHGLIKNLHTMLILGTHLNGENTSLVFAAIDNLFTELSVNISTDMKIQLQNMITIYLKPLAEQTLRKVEKLPTEKKDFDIQTQYAGDGSSNVNSVTAISAD